MSFLNPWMLMGLAAAAVPIAVHFFNLRRPRRVDFSSLAFVRQVEQRTMQRLRLKRWLLLALRVLAVACLALAFARPVLDADLAGAVGGGAAAEAPAALGIVLDNSLSMARRSGGRGPLLDRARARANDLSERMRPGDELHLEATAGFDGAARQVYRNAGAAREALGGAEARPGAEPLARTAQRAARRLSESARPNRALYLLTDLQASTLTDSLTEETAASAENLRAALVPVGAEASPENVAVTDAVVESRIVEVGQPVRVRATLENFGGEERAGHAASLYLEGERQAQATADLEAGASQTVTFTVTPRRRGWLAGRVETQGDALAADDTRHFVLHVPRSRRVLVVRGRETSGARYVELALASAGGEGGSVFDVETIGEGQLAGADLAAYDAVALVGPQALASGTRGALARYVENGGGLLFFPGEEMQQADYNALFERLGGGRLTGVSGEAPGGEGRSSVTSFDRVDTDHPLFEGVFDPARSGGGRQVERPVLYRVADYTAGAGSEQTLIRLSNGRPFFQEIRRGQGTVLFMAAAPSERWSDLPTRGLFVPLLYRSLFYLSASGAPSAGEGLVAGRPGEIRVRTADAAGAEPLRLVGPAGEEVTPEQRRLFGATLLQTSGRLRAPGIYDVRRDGETVRRVALNLDPAESDVRAATPEEAAERLSAALGIDVEVLSEDADLGEVARALRAGRTGRELWNVFLLLALLLLAAEMLVAHHWTPEET